MNFLKGLVHLTILELFIFNFGDTLGCDQEAKLTASIVFCKHSLLYMCQKQNLLPQIKNEPSQKNLNDITGDITGDTNMRI